MSLQEQNRYSLKYMNIIAVQMPDCTGVNVVFHPVVRTIQENIKIVFNLLLNHFSLILLYNLVNY